MGKKMGEKRGKDKREPVIYRIRSPSQNAEDGVKQPEGRRQADRDNKCLGMSVQWEQIWDPWLVKGAFSGSSLKVDDFW
jgi:hypothetical protein